MERVPTFELENLLHSRFVKSVRAQAVESLGRENDHTAAFECLDGCP
jgi:hypothetical protein